MTHRWVTCSFDDICTSLMRGYKYIVASLACTPDMYLDEIKAQLKEACGVKVSLSLIWRELQWKGFSMKKVCCWTSHFVPWFWHYHKITKAALECNKARWACYIYSIGTKYQPEHLVFVDESLFDHQTTYQGYAWALKGQRAVHKCFFICGKQYILRYVLDCTTHS